MSLRQHASSLAVLPLVVVVACGQPTTKKNDDGPKSHAPAVDLVVDANRDGALDLTGDTDEAGKDDFTATAGASVLANLDDDDQDGKPDATEESLAGDADTKDLSLFAVRAFAAAPDGATGTLSIDAASLPHVRLFSVAGPTGSAASYAELKEPAGVPLGVGNVRAGVTFALEATAFLGTTADDWNGRVELTYEVKDETGKSLGVDHALLRVAPVLFQWNTAKTQHVYYTADPDYGETDTLRDGVKAVCTDGIDEVGLDLPANDWDQWAQDFFDVGYTSRPGPDGAPAGMKVYTKSAQTWRPAGKDVITTMLGPDVATVEVVTPNFDYGNGNGDSMSSFGNWDVVPPYDKGDEHYPLGRNFWGKGPTTGDQPDPAYEKFVSSQAVQPELHIDTTFLLVGHVDEITSFVPTNTPRGWGLLAAKPSLSKSMLEGLQAAGHGSEQMFVGKGDFDYIDWNGYSDLPEIDGAVSIDDVLSNADIMAESQKAEVATDAAVNVIQDAVGLSDDEITSMPFLFEPVTGFALAYQPGTVNLLDVDGHVVVPQPFGPTVDGADPFEADITSRLSTLGLDVHFADDWETYHIEMGEVHCGTNVSRDLAVKWWESGR